jgi:hypothetical protein
MAPKRSKKKQSRAHRRAKRAHRKAGRGHGARRPGAARPGRRPRTPLALLTDAGLVLPNPRVLDDDALHEKLWAMLHGMAGLGIYVLNADHLDDRRLYRQLWEEALRVPVPRLRGDLPAVHFIDFSGGVLAPDPDDVADEVPDRPLPSWDDGPFEAVVEVTL